MAFQAVPDVAEAVVQYFGNTKTMVNTFHALLPGGYDLADLAVLAAVVDANVAASWLTDMSQDYAYVQTVVRGLASENDQEVTDGTSAGPGLLAEDALPGNVTLSIKQSSGQTGRSARGRIYIVGCAPSQLGGNENQFTQVAVDTFVDNVDSMRGSINGTVWTPVIVSRFTGGAKRPVGVTFPWIGQSAVNRNVDSQRSRLL